MAKERAFLKYLGDRKWRRIKNANISTGKSYLVYLGNRKWKRKSYGLRANTAQLDS